MNSIVEQVKTELFRNKLQNRCPKCRGKVLTAVYTQCFRVDLVAETSEEVEENGTLLGIHCEQCSWSVDDVVEEEEE